MIIDCIIGIDPGASGGIVTWRPNEVAKAIKMPKDLNALAEYLKYIKSVSHPLVFLEKLSVRPDDVVAVGTCANMGKLYRIQKMLQNFEHLKAILTVSGVPFVMVHPMKWQNELKLRVKGSTEDKAQRKRRYRDLAGQLYPEIKSALWSADATLIMHFGRRILQRDPEWVKQNLPSVAHNSLF